MTDQQILDAFDECGLDVRDESDIIDIGRFSV